MVLLFLLVGFALGFEFSFKNLGARVMGFDEGSDCKFTRADAIVCLAEWVDVDRNGQISEDEFERAKKLYPPPQAKALLWLAKEFSHDIPFSQVMRDCDFNHDNLLTPWDMLHSTKTCLPTQRAMCMLSTICKRAARMSKI